MAGALAASARTTLAAALALTLAALAAPAQEAPGGPRAGPGAVQPAQPLALAAPAAPPEVSPPAPPAPVESLPDAARPPDPQTPGPQTPGPQTPGPQPPVTQAPAFQAPAALAPGDAGADTPAAGAAPPAGVSPPAPPVPQAAAEGAGEADLWTIVLRAHPVVQGTMALLAAMVFLVVTIFLFKMTEVAMSERRLGRGFRRLAAARSLADLPPAAASARRAAEPGTAMLRAIGDELAEMPVAIGRIEAEGLSERLGLAFDRIEAAAVARLRAGTGALPQIASTAPFIGLFGTVFGIMNAFLAIAETGTTSLAVVAPGIAEALLATAIGLVAAIPAVIVHNMLQRRIAGYRQRIDDVAALAARLVSQDVTARRLAGRAAGLE